MTSYFRFSRPTARMKDLRILFHSHSGPRVRGSFLRPAQVVKAVLPLINSGAVVAREPNVADPATLHVRAVEAVQLPPLGAIAGSHPGNHSSYQEQARRRPARERDDTVSL